MVANSTAYRMSFHVALKRRKPRKTLLTNEAFIIFPCCLSLLVSYTFVNIITRCISIWLFNFYSNLQLIFKNLLVYLLEFISIVRSYVLIFIRGFILKVCIIPFVVDIVAKRLVNFELKKQISRLMYIFIVWNKTRG